MVHRLPDSRLLSNLISHEKEYTKHLSSLFPISHAALASLSAFAAASPSVVSFSKSSISLAQTIGSVVDVLTSADDALQRYNQALENWHNQLGHLLKLEEEIGAILRDREILVTRLIKVSKSSKAARDSRSSLVVPSGSASLTSLPSINSTAHSSSSTKLLQAQGELRACETHLATKELELEACRVSIAREGLGARCQALIDCGWAWGKVGEEGLRALQCLGVVNSDDQAADPTSSSHSQLPPVILSQQKPSHPSALLPHLPLGPISYSSDISSLTPSQSISQQHGGETNQEGALDHPILHGREDVTVTIPPAHAISELTMPTGVRSPSPLTSPSLEGPRNPHETNAEARSIPRTRSTKQKRRPLSRRITEDEDEFRKENTTPPESSFPSLERTRGDDDSSEEEPQGPLEVIENDPFRQPKCLGLGQELAPDAVQLIHERNGRQRERGRKLSLNFFGSLRDLLKTLHKDQPRMELTDSTSPLVSKGGKEKKGWSTRTDANLKAARSRGSLDSGPDMALKTPMPLGGAKLRKGNRSTTRTITSSSGWQTDGPASASPRATIKRKKKLVAELNGRDGGYTDGELDENDLIPSILPSRSQSETVARHPSPKRQAPSSQATPVDPSRASSSSLRDDIILSPSLSGSASARHRRATTDISGYFDRGNGEAFHDGSPQRSASLTYGAASQRVTDPPAAAKPRPKSTVKVKSGTIHPLPTKGSNGASLMSIIEDVSRQNCNNRNIAITPLTSVPSRSPDRSSSITQKFHQSATKLEVPRAPIPGVPINATWSSKLSDKSPIRRRTASLDFPYVPGSAFSQSLPVVSGTQGTIERRHETTPSAACIGQGSYLVSASGSGASRPAVSPLRSALRNSSRTPSPSPVQMTKVRKRGADMRPDVGNTFRGRAPEREESRQCDPRPAQLVQDAQLNNMSIRDSISMTSISSYVTGRESPFEAEPAPQAPPSQPDTDLSTISTEILLTGRKSVRVSLQPTFSPTPPALEDDETHRRYPWNSSEVTIKDGTGELDLWQDSSEEDEEYVRARKLLSRVNKKDKGKNKV